MTALNSIYTNKRLAGLEGDCAERSEVKTSQCDVFKERAPQSLPIPHAATNEQKQFCHANICYLHQREKQVKGLEGEQSENHR